MEVRIRLGRTSDAEAICRLSRMELGYGYPAEKVLEKLSYLLKRPDNRIFVAEQDGAVVGYIHAVNYDVLYAPHMKNIMGLAVAEECRKQGIGRALLEAAEEWARESGAAGVRLVSGEARSGAHVFYQHCGYVCGKKQLNFHKNFHSR